MVESFLLIESLDLFIHLVNQQILFLFGLLEVAHVLFCAVGGPSRDCNLALHDFVVLFNLLESSIELVQLLLGLEHSLELLVSLLLFAFILTLEDLILALSFHSVSLDDVVVVMSALKCCLHASQLVLDSVQLHTSLLSRLSDLPDFLLLLSQLQINTLVLVCQLLCQGVLKPSHQRLNKENQSVTGPIVGGNSLHGLLGGKSRLRRRSIGPLLPLLPPRLGRLQLRGQGLALVQS